MRRIHLELVRPVKIRENNGLIVEAPHVVRVYLVFHPRHVIGIHVPVHIRLRRLLNGLLIHSSDRRLRNYFLDCRLGESGLVLRVIRSGVASGIEQHRVVLLIVLEVNHALLLKWHIVGVVHLHSFGNLDFGPDWSFFGKLLGWSEVFQLHSLFWAAFCFLF